MTGTGCAFSSRERFLATYPGAEDIGVNPAGVGTVEVAIEDVEVVVVVVPVVTTVVVVALGQDQQIGHIASRRGSTHGGSLSRSIRKGQCRCSDHRSRCLIVSKLLKNELDLIIGLTVDVLVLVVVTGGGVMVEVGVVVNFAVTVNGIVKA